MGAQYDSVSIPITPDLDLHKAFAAIIEKMSYDYGHRGYTGTLVEAQGLVVLADHPPFENDNAADEWLDENCDKWGPAKAVRVLEYQARRGTAAWMVAPHWRIGAMCSS